jgi:hypothetical protein
MYKVTFKSGLGTPIIVEAENEIEAKKKGLEHYRKNLTLMSNWSINQVVESAERI